MHSVVKFLFLFLGFFAAESVLSAELTNTANILEFPYYASIETNGEFLCAATIVDDKYVMSTNSCVTGYNASSLQVRVGTDKQGHRGQLFQVTYISPYVNSGFNPGPGPTPSFAADVALIKIAVSFTYDPHVMWLNPNNDGIHELQGGVISSWANPKVLGSPLISASVTVLPPAGCASLYNGVRNISSTEFCVWPSDSSSQPCLAALGAPFYYNEQYYGLVTYNPGCDSSAYPVIVTEVSQFTSFIITVLCDMASFFP